MSSVIGRDDHGTSCCRHVAASSLSMVRWVRAGPRSVHQIHGFRSRLHNWEIDAHVHRGLHQVLWLRAGQVDAMLDESRSRNSGPVVHVIPPGVAHSFCFSPGSDGFVLTVNANLLAEGDAAAVGEALQELFAEPRARCPWTPIRPMSCVSSRCSRRFTPRARPLTASTGRCPGGWRARSSGAWLCWRGAHRRAGVRRGGVGRQLLYSRWVVLLESHYLDHSPSLTLRRPPGPVDRAPQSHGASRNG